jgi:hypothetical protein
LAAALAAEKSGKRVEVTDAKSENGQTWANPDGTFTSSMASGPVRFKKSSGDWQDIDLTARVAADGSITATAAERAVTLPGTSAGGVSIPTAAGPVVITHPGASSVTPRIDGSVVTYPGAVGGKDLIAQLLVHGVEETVVLDDSTEGPSYTTSFTLPVGVQARDGANGVDFTDATGTSLGRFGGGVAFDAAGAETVVATAITGQSGRVAT